MTTSFNYRAHRPTVVARLRERLEALDHEATSLAVRQRLVVHRRRFARAVAGTVGALGGLGMLATAVVALIADQLEGVAVLVLAGALVAVPVSYLVAYLLAPPWERRRMARLLARSQDPEMDLAIVERASPRSVAARWAERWEAASLTMPLVAVALLGPLALHAIVFVSVVDGEVGDLGYWMGLSAVIVGHAHLAFAGLAARYVRELRSGTLSSHPAFRMWTTVTLVSAMPGVLLLGLPPLLTGLTGAFLVYPMCAWADVALRRERLVLAD